MTPIARHVSACVSACLLVALPAAAAPQVLRGKPEGEPAPPASADRVTPAPVVAAAPAQTAIDPLDLDFSGAGADAMRRLAQPAPAALRSAVHRLIGTAATAGDCSTYAAGDRTFLADLDGDGRPEGLAFYTLESCGGGGNNYVRTGALLRETGAGGWAKVTEFTMGTALVGNRVVTSMADGALTLAGNGQPFASTEPPQTVRIPPANR